MSLAVNAEVNVTAIYLRKSRAEEVDTTEETLQKHKDALFEFAKNNKLDIIKIYEEVASGETLSARPQMLKLLEDVEQGLYDGVLCMDIDRLGRGGMAEQGIILETFKHSNTKIITPRKIYDLNNEMDEDYTEFQTFFARRELKTIKRRMQQGKEASIKNGCYMSNAPFGYEKATKDKNPTLVINEEEAPFIRMMFEWYIDGMGCQLIADRLNAMGAKPRRSDKFSRSSVMHILKNPTFAGKIVWNRKNHIRKGAKGNKKHVTIYNKPDKWVIVDGIHEPIITEDTFNRAQLIIKNRTHPPSNTGEVKNPLAGLCYCSVCDFSMVRQHRINEPDRLLCPTAGCQKSTMIKYVEEKVINFISDTLKDIKLGKFEKKDKAASNKKALDLITKERNTLNNQKNKLYDLLEQGVYTITVFEERMDVIKRKLSELEETKGQYKKQKDVKKLSTNIENTLNLYKKSDIANKNKLLKSVISKIEYKKENSSPMRECELSIELKF